MIIMITLPRPPRDCPCGAWAPKRGKVLTSARCRKLIILPSITDVCFRGGHLHTSGSPPCRAKGRPRIGCAGAGRRRAPSPPRRAGGVSPLLGAALCTASVHGGSRPPAGVRIGGGFQAGGPTAEGADEDADVSPGGRSA